MFWLSRGVNLYPTTKGGKLAIKKKTTNSRWLTLELNELADLKCLSYKQKCLYKCVQDSFTSSEISIPHFLSV